MTRKFGTLARQYATLWDSMEITRDHTALARTAERIEKHRQAYEQVQQATGVPWVMIGIMDMREGGGGACTHLHNGDSLALPTRHVPKGRPAGSGPFSFADSAIDALRLKGMHEIGAWPVERIAYEFERYNGFGYRARDVRSPYLWGGTSHQQPGKYIADHVWDPTVMDSQHGCMPLLKVLAERNGIEIASLYGATADPAQATPASNSKASPPAMSPTAKVLTAVTTAATVSGTAATTTDPVAATGAMVALKSNLGQLLAGLPVTTWGVPLLIIASVASVIVWARRQA